MAFADKKLQQLQKSIEWSDRQLEYLRKERLKAIKEYVGAHYSQGGSEKVQPVSFLEMAVSIYARSLAAKAPKVMISAEQKDFRPIAADFELALNRVPEEIGLADTLRRWVVEALFSIGVLKCGIAEVDKVLGHSYGKAFIDLVTPDDYFVDMSAKDHRAIQYEGNSYWMPYEELMDSDWVKKGKGDLKPDDFTVMNDYGQEQAQSVSSSETPELFKEKVRLRDVWLPAEKLMLTYAVTSKKLLKEQKREGPRDGPYIKLGFGVVPGNLLPLAPVSIWRDLHELSNALFRKLANQADSQKTVQGFPGGSQEDVQVFQKAKDGDGIHWSGGQPQALAAGGIDQTTLAFFLQTRDLSSYYGGNLDALGGLSPQSDTLGQDRLLTQAASARLNDMMAQTIDGIRKVFRVLAYYEYTDPISRRDLKKPIKGTDMSVPVDWGPESRKPDFDLFDLDIDVYSMQEDAPSQKLQKLSMVMQQYVLPLMPAIQQAGGQLDIEAVLRLLARYTDFPELGDLVIFADNPDVTKHDEGGAKPAETKRTYERVNRPGATAGGKSQILQQALMGGKPQASEAAAVGRPTG